MKTVFRALVAVGVLLALVAPASAATITYKLLDLGSNNYEYLYTVTGAPANTTAFEIYFPDVTVSEPLVYSFGPMPYVAPAGWAAIVYGELGNLATYTRYYVPGNQPATSFPYEGFIMMFHYTGQAPLGSQYYRFYDTASVQIASGWTVKEEVPEPATVLVVGIGLAAIAVRRRRSR